MKKVKLQNMQAIGKIKMNGPLDGTLNLNENGILNDSGVIDDSGSIDNSGSIIPSGFIDEEQHGYEYEYATVGGISVRYVIIWHRSRKDFYADMYLDDGTTNPYASGYIGDPITNSDPEHYEFINQRIQVTGVSALGTFSASWTIEYLYFPYGRECTISEECQPQHKYASDMISFQVPPYIENEEE